MIPLPKQETAFRRRRLMVVVFLMVVVVGFAGLYGLAQWKTARVSRQAQENGIAAYEAGEYEEAVQELERAILHDDQDADLLTKLALAKLGLGRGGKESRQSAVVLLERAVSIQANHQEARWALLRLYVHGGFTVEALEHADYILSLNPRDLSAFRIKIELLTQLGDFEGLMESAKTLETLGGMGRPIAVEVAVARSVAWQGLGNQGRAYIEAKSAFDLDPLSERALLIWLDRRARQDVDPEPEIERLVELSQERPDDPQPIRALAMVCRYLSDDASRAGNTTSAEQWIVRGRAALLEFINRTDLDDEAISTLAPELNQFGEAGLVFEALGRSLKRQMEPAKMRAWALQGLLLGRDESILAEWHTLAESRPLPKQAPSLAGMVAFAASRTGDGELAESILGELTELAELDSVELDFWRAAAGEAVPDGVVSAFLEASPRHPVAGLYRAKRDVEAGNLDAAELRLAQLANAWPGWAEPAIRLSDLHRQSGNGPAAISWAARAQRADPYGLAASMNLLNLMVGFPRTLSVEQAQYGLTLLRNVQPQIASEQVDRMRLIFGLLSADAEAVEAEIRSWLGPDHPNASSVAILSELAGIGEMMGRSDLAMDIFESLAENDEHHPTAKRDLIRLRVADGNFEILDSYIGSLSDPPEIADLQLIARASMAAQRPVDRDWLVSQVSRLNLDAAEAKALLADVLALAGEHADAIIAYDQSLDFDSSRALTWRALVKLLIQLENPTWFQRLADSASAAMDDPVLESLAQAEPDPMDPFHAEAVLLALGDDPERVGAYAALIQIDREDLDAAKWNQLLADYPDVAGLAILRLDRFSLESDPAPYLETSVRIGRQFANDPRVTRRVCSLLIRGGDFDRALLAAETWRHRGNGSLRSIDFVRADLNLRLGRPKQAKHILAPYRFVPESQNETDLPLVVLQTRIALAEEEFDSAWAVLAPLVELDAKWRSLAMHIATEFVDEPQVALDWLEQIRLAIPTDSDSEQEQWETAYRSASE